MYKKVLNRYLHAQRPDKAASEIGLAVIVIMALAPVVLRVQILFARVEIAVKETEAEEARQPLILRFL